MATREEVERFINNFQSKLKVFQIIFRDDRGKNTQALAELENFADISRNCNQRDCRRRLFRRADCRHSEQVRRDVGIRKRCQKARGLHKDCSRPSE
mgnify:CR=1 FL=1